MLLKWLTQLLLLLFIKTVLIVEVRRREKTSPFPVCLGYVDVVFQTASEIRKIPGFYNIRDAKCVMKTDVILTLFE